VGVLAQPSRPRGRGLKVDDPPAVRRACEAGLPVFQPARPHATEALASLRALEPDLTVTAAFGRILRPSLLQLAPRGAWNVHASLLPRHRGASPVSAAIQAGDAWTGVTIFQLDEGLDTGDLLSQEMIPIFPGETCGELTSKLATLGGDLLVRTLNAEAGAPIPRRPQPVWGVTHAPILTKDAGRIEWARPAEHVERHVRAVDPWPGAFTWIQGQRLRVHRVGCVHRLPGDDEPGVLRVVDGIPQVTCLPGAVALLEVQAEGRKRQEAREWLRGSRQADGARLGDGP